MKKIKKEKDNKKIVIIVSILTLFIIGILILLVVLNKENKNEITKYLKVNDQTIYLYNIEEVFINLENNKITLKDYVKDSDNLDNAFSVFEQFLEVDKILRDGGTIIYKTKKNNNFFKDNLVIIRCNTEDGNKDIYFGKNIDTLEAFENGACGKNFFNNKEFTKVYLIDKIEEIEEDENYYLLKLTIKDEEKSVTIERSLRKEIRDILVEDKKYTFYFENKYSELIKDDITEIFDKATLTGVVPYNS